MFKVTATLCYFIVQPVMIYCRGKLYSKISNLPTTPKSSELCGLYLQKILIFGFNFQPVFVFVYVVWYCLLFMVRHYQCTIVRTSHYGTS